MKHFLSIGLVLFLLTSCQTTENKEQQEDITQAPKSMCVPRTVDPLMDTDLPAPLFEGLGDYTFPITTNSKEAQRYFEQGFKLANAFNHAEAARSFKYATKLDPECAMCHWGLDYVLGHNYNVRMDPEVVTVASNAAKKAVKYMDYTTPREQILIKAMAKRYPDKAVDDRSTFDQAYAEALREAYKQYPQDDDIGALLVESIMDMHPWDLWKKDGNPQPWTPELLTLLEEILQRNPDHVASIHLYIHATEASFTPEKALAAAERLPTITPGAGHLVHMPSHTYIRTGHYNEGVAVNQKAVEVDSIYVSACHAAGLYPLAYYPHNYHFLTACAALAGRSKISLEAAQLMVKALDTEIMREPGYGTIQHYWSIPFYIMVKFEKWNDILELPEPDQDLIYPRAIWHYARGMAYQGLGKLNEAEAELEKLNKLRKEESLAEMTVWDINSISDLLNIASNVLGGEIAAGKGDYYKAGQLLEAAVAMEDQLNYNEPPDWFFSVRHHLGAILLEAGEYAKAEAVYKRDLELFPETGWALGGLYTSLSKQNKQKEAAEIKQRFEKAWQYADTPII